MATASINAKWMAAAPGDVIEIPAGDYERETLKPSKRPKGSAPVTIKPVDGAVVRLLADPTVGSTDTVLLKSGLRDLILKNLIIEVDDRAGIKTEGDLGARKVTLIDCVLKGLGAESTWAQHHYFTGAWSELGTITNNVLDEHAWYGHQIAGNHAWSRCVTNLCGRTRLQIVNRKKEGATPMPVGYGDITIVDDVVNDVCIGQGGQGSAYTFRGGCPTTTVRLERCKVRLGCDRTLAPQFQKNITGSFVMDSSPESKPGAGDDAHPGGTKALYLIEPDFEVGSEFPGYGGARRPNVKVGAVGEFSLDWGEGGRIVQGPGAHQIALEIFKSCQSFHFTGEPAAWNGEMHYKGERFFSWDAFADAHPECRR